MVLPVAVFFLAGAPLEFSYPKLRGFNFEGGIVILPELMALILGLVIYTGAFIAEIVRAGIQGVPKGQKEAAVRHRPHRPARRCASSSSRRPCASSFRL